MNNTAKTTSTANALNILLPNKKTIYVDTGCRQRAEYLQLPEEPSDFLTEDVENGASVYKPLLSYFDKKPAQYSIITAPCLEDGLRAVTYLACEDLKRDGADADVYDDDIAEEQLQETDYDEFDSVFYDTYSDDDDDDDCDPFNAFEENPYKIPIIDEMALQSSDFANAQSFGFFNQEMNSSNRSRKSWWEDCAGESICIYCDAGYMDDDFLGDGYCLNDCFIDALKRFGSNKHVYLLIIGNHIPEDDLSITKCMLEYTANLYRITPDKSELSEYYQRILVETAGKYGLSFADSLDLKLLTEKLCKINNGYPCQIFDKIMLYFTHKGVSGKINITDLTSLGLAKLINSVDQTRSSKKVKEELWGMAAVKKNVENIIDTLKYNALRKKRGLKTTEYHNVHLFIGAPGTAKTTVAKYMAAKMQEEGLLSGNRFISVSGAQLKGAYVGQTAPKVHALFESYDAILIDEAYSLICEHSKDSYAEEALAQLAIELENHATDKLIIFAGYGGKNVSRANNRMYDFLEANPGIKSRIASTIVFDSYSPEEMVQILHHMLRKTGLRMNHTYDSLIQNYFAGRCTSQDFGNGREARNFAESLQRCIASRVMSEKQDKITDAKLSTITKADIVTTITDFKEMTAQQVGQARLQLGF